MALLTIRQKQQILGWIVGPVAVLAFIVAFFRYVPWLAWPLTAAVVGLIVWGIVRGTRRRSVLPSGPAAKTLDVTVPFGPEDTVESIALKLIEAAEQKGQRVSTGEARRVAELELRKARGDNERTPGL